MGESINCRLELKARSGDLVPIQIKSGLSRSSSGNSVNSGSDYAVPRCQSFTSGPERDQTPSSSEDSGSSCGSMQRGVNKKGPMKGIHGLTMSKHPSQDSIDQSRNSIDAVAQYATLRRSSSRKQSSQSLDLNPHGYPASPVSKCSNGSISPGIGSLPSPFANFKSPYTQIHNGEVKNQLNKDRRSNSVPSSPVAKIMGQNSPRQPPAPPKRTMSMKTSSNSIPTGTFSTPAGDEELEQHSFPPPLSPVAFNLEAMKATQPKTGTEYRTNFAERRQSPSRDALKLQNVTESSLAARRRASSAEKEANSNNSNSWQSNSEDKTPVQEEPRAERSSSINAPRSSIESIPFANDNAGTIKQRGAQSRAAITAIDFIEDSFDRALESGETEESDFDYDTVKRMPKPGEYRAVAPFPTCRCDDLILDFLPFQ